MAADEQVDKRTRIRRAAYYVIADWVENSLLNGEDLAWEADHFNVTIAELITELKRQVQIMEKKAVGA
jgi:hypothetical protein